MSYFNNFPKVKVDMHEGANQVLVTDITRRVRFFDMVKSNNVTYDFYDVKSGETPEFVANEFYGDPLLHWVVLLVNDIQNVYDGWPMAVQQFESYVHAKYDNVDDIHHYEIPQTSGDTEKVIEIPNDPANTIPANAVIVTNYEHEERKENVKRRIRLLKPEFVRQVKQELKSRLRGN